MRGVFLDRETVDPGDLDDRLFRQSLEQWSFFDTLSPEPLAQRIRAAQVIVSNKLPLDRGLLSGPRPPELICVAATGTNNVDLEFARQRGIPVCNVRDYATPSVVQHVFALLLALTTHLLRYRELAIAGAWAGSPRFCILDQPIRELAGLCIGIVGYGVLGRAVARLAEAFGMQVLVAKRDAADQRPGRVALHELLSRVDVLSLHCPLTDATRNLIDGAALALMKPDAVLINTARGGLVDEAALRDALVEGRLGGAGIDVLSEEPPVSGSALLDAGVPNLIVTPHVAWASRESRQRLLDELASNIAAFRRGEPRNLV